MATDYRIGIRCWQDQAGDEDTKINVYFNDTKVVSEATVSGTDPDSDYNVINWESTGLADPFTNTRHTIKVEIANNLYVDSSTDRTIHINGIGYLDKDTDGNYKLHEVLASDSSETPDTTRTNTASETKNVKIHTNPSASDWSNYVGIADLPISVTSSNIEDGWWDTVIATDSFHTITVWGDETDGVSIVFEINGSGQANF